MRFRNIILLLFCLPTAGLAQNANNWINFSQTYYKVSIAKNGIYHLTYNDLLAAGLPVNIVDPRLIQLFHRGVEQAVFFKHDQTPADPNFDPTEYLEFYGRKNDGTLDAKLYKPAGFQPNQFFNLYSDTTAYFLTWNNLPVQGKRMELFDQVNSTGLPEEVAHANERLFVLTNEYCGGDIIEKYITQSFFDEGEGWTGPIICTNPGCAGQQDFQIDLLNNGVPSSGVPTLELQVAGRDHLQHRVEVYAGATAGTLRLITSADFQNFQTPILSSTLNWTDIGVDGTMVVRVKALGVGGIRDRLSVSYLRVTFPQNFNMSGLSEKDLHLNTNLAGKSYIEFDNAVAATRLWDVTQPSDVVMIGTKTNGSILSAIVPNTAVKRHLLVSSNTNSISASQLKKISFRELNTASDFLIVSHKSLMQPALSYSNPVTAFADYRASVAGGEYDTLTVTIDQLYNQFNYGETSPTAIYEFMRFMIAHGDPKYLFLVGKGRDVSSGFHRKTVLSPGEMKDLVPTAGTPSSDMTFTAGMDGEEFVPAVSTGRLTASTPQQVAAYLNKVKEAEAVPFQQLWRKKILHLSGGIQANELPLFRQYMNGFADLAKGPFLGGEVITVGKHDATAVEFINISKEINEGLNFVTFFGHSSSQSTDIDIGNVSEPILGYNNSGKYPAFLVNGCNAGEFFSNGTNFGEDWIMASNKGARNFIANSGFGFDGLLRYYTTLFYEVAFADSVFINKGIGDIQKEVASRFLSTTGNVSSIYTAQVQQMVLLGDPSVRLFSPTKPDFEMSNASISVIAFDDKPIHALTDSIEIQIIVKNLGRVVNEPLHVRVKHTIGEASFQYDSLFESVLFQDTLRLPIKRGTIGFFGANVLEIILDPLDVIAELAEDNNSGSWSKLISFNGTMNLQPQDFGIVSSNDVELVFQDTDLRAPQKTYVLELDSSRSFNSGFLKTGVIQAKVLSRNHFTLPDIDSTVYYWRTKIQGQPDDLWETTSFAYLRGSPEGWAQIQFDQLTENSFSGLVPDPVNMKMDFEQTSVSIFVKTFGSNSPTPSFNGSFQVDNAEYYFSPQGFNCRNNTINLVAFDRSTVVPYLAVPFTFQNSGGRACGREPQLINSFAATETDTGNNDDLIQYIDNVKSSDSVVLFVMGDAGFSTWSPQVKLKLAELGISSTDIDTFLPGEPVIMLARKGSPPGSAKILRSDLPLPQEQELQLSEDIHGRISAGALKSVVVGPAVLWKTVFPTIQSVESTDVIGIDLYGIMQDGKEVLLLSDLKQQFNIESINPLVYPFLKLAYRAEDDTNLTPPQLIKWIVTFDPAPDGLLVFKDPPGQVSLPEGSFLQSNFGFVNISNKPFLDSLNVNFAILNKGALTTETKNFKIKGPAPGDTSSFITNTDTRFRLGLNDLSVVVNHNIVVEQYYQNNSIELVNYLNVSKDRSNPILDVTFDGRYLANGDYVSSNPFILIKVRDENPLLLQTDTTGVLVLLRYPCAVEDCPETRINLSGKEIKWFPATSSNELRIEFNPETLQDGTYTLFVLAEDVSGNPSGEVPYEISFNVSSEPSVIFSSPYPNPSPAGFFFEFQVAGKTAPEAFLLQIFNRDGQLVAAYNEQEVSLSYVGRNQLKWSGLDEQGNRLSDGIYLYRLSVKAGNREFRTSGKLMVLH